LDSRRARVIYFCLSPVPRFLHGIEPLPQHPPPLTCSPRSGALRPTMSLFSPLHFLLSPSLCRCRGPWPSVPLLGVQTHTCLFSLWAPAFQDPMSPPNLLFVWVCPILFPAHPWCVTTFLPLPPLVSLLFLFCLPRSGVSPCQRTVRVPPSHRCKPLPLWLYFTNLCFTHHPSYPF